MLTVRLFPLVRSQGGKVITADNIKVRTKGIVQELISFSSERYGSTRIKIHVSRSKARSRMQAISDLCPMYILDPVPDP